MHYRYKSFTTLELRLVYLGRLSILTYSLETSVVGVRWRHRDQEIIARIEGGQVKQLIAVRTLELVGKVMWSGRRLLIWMETIILDLSSGREKIK